jgi:hypothetical protein
MKRAPWLSLCLLACQPQSDVVTSPTQSVTASSSHQSLGERRPYWGSSVIALEADRWAAADPEANAVHAVYFSADTKAFHTAAISTGAGSAPFRMAQVGRSQVAVVLRGSGEVAMLDTTALKVEWRRTVCAEPRGIAWDADSSTARVACASGELYTVSEERQTSIDTGLELRDVLLVNGALWVTTFRSAELLELDPADGSVRTRLSPASVGGYMPQVAWRTVTDGDLIVMSHQLHYASDVNNLVTTPAVPYYGVSACFASAVTSALTVFDPKARSVKGTLARPGALPVDVAFDGQTVAVVSTGGGLVETYDPGFISTGACTGGVPAGSGLPAPSGVAVSGGSVAVFDQTGWFGVNAATPDDGHAVRTRTPDDVARAVFHAQSPSGVACASCHAEGYDDGHTWTFGTSIVRTQSLEGGLFATAPYHWDGEFSTLPQLLDVTWVKRMGGAPLNGSDATALGAWLNALPARKGRQARGQGEAYFASDGCSTCHSGSAFTNGATVDVGTGGAFQVPSLRAVSWRGPWLHDGCAATLEDRFSDACGGQTHAPVPPDHVAELVEYLKSL